MLSDTATLQAWQKTAFPSHEQRDAMMKLGSDWHVPQKNNGQKRKLAEVAEDLQKQLIRTAKRLLEYRTPCGNKRGHANPLCESTYTVIAVKTHTESEPAGSKQLGPIEFVVNKMERLEAQARGFTHAHWGTFQAVFENQLTVVLDEQH